MFFNGIKDIADRVLYLFRIAACRCLVSTEIPGLICLKLCQHSNVYLRIGANTKTCLTWISLASMVATPVNTEYFLQINKNLFGKAED